MQDGAERCTMRGPFPGMDPYLEEPTEWPDLHSGLITTIRDTLAAEVAPHYIVRIEQRVHIATPDDPGYQAIVPDVYLVREPARGVGSAPAGAISTPTLIEPLADLEIRDRFIEVLDARNRALVATLETLSPANKTAGALARQGFERKRRAVLSSATHWIELDLLRGGERPSEVAGKSDYYALLRRGGAFPYEVWYWDLRDPLPTIAVPLLPPHPDVPLDLGAVLAGVYKRAFYALSVDYTRPV
ncbi:MAG: hypothetical protein AVDCRST_MAG88-4736, partial [uncultured Thermomicrobiales bacterium]